MKKKEDVEYTSMDDPTPKRPWDPKKGTDTSGTKKKLFGKVGRKLRKTKESAKKV